MFEKEAEEYYYKTYPVTLNIGEEERKKEVTDIFIKGAEFGYNKANEWHYVKDGDLPKDDNDVLVLLKDETMQVDYYFSKIGWNISLKADVIAWKEIVLPKESE